MGLIVILAYSIGVVLGALSVMHLWGPFVIMSALFLLGLWLILWSVSTWDF